MTQNCMYTIFLVIFCIISLPLLPFASPFNAFISPSPSFRPCHSWSVSFYLIHPQAPLEPPALDRLAHTHISSTDCLSSIFCSTLHHNTNRWITFLAPELCTNISRLREQEGIKNVTTRALEVTGRFSQSHTVWLVGIHHLLHRLNAAATVFCLPAPFCCFHIWHNECQLSVCTGDVCPLFEFHQISQPAHYQNRRCSSTLKPTCNYSIQTQPHTLTSSMTR